MNSDDTNDYGDWHKDYDYIEYISKMIRGIIIPYDYTYKIAESRCSCYTDEWSSETITRTCDWCC